MKKYFCAKPFEWFETSGREGDRSAHLCCPGWLEGKSLPLDEEKPDQAWNSARAQEIRRSIHDGSFRFCGEHCPYLHDPERYADDPVSPLMRREDVTEPRLREVIDSEAVELVTGPRTWTLSHDETCNLSCRSCRMELIALSREEADGDIAFQERLLEAYGDGLRQIYVTGSGDPFASRAYREILKSLSRDRFPDLTIKLHSNGLLWTRSAWPGLGGACEMVTDAEISIDAASAGAYAVTRAGDWSRLMDNLAFIAELRRSGPLKFVQLSFVVQKANYREMPAFVELAERYGFDKALFTRIRNWGTFKRREYADVDVASSRHPEHEDLCSVLSDARLAKPIADLGELRAVSTGGTADSGDGPASRPTTRWLRSLFG